MRTDQEAFWSGDFGKDYVKRNESPELLASNVALFSRILRQKVAPKSVLEIGANIGLNLSALARLFPAQVRTGIEINPLAHARLEKNPHVDRAILGSVTEAALDSQFDLVLSKGVLIHLDPSSLRSVYEKIARWSRKHVLLIEYYSPSPQVVPYRGHSEKLFKRDFAGEYLDCTEDFELSDYGFIYHREDPYQDDLTWFLLTRKLPIGSDTGQGAS